MSGCGVGEGGLRVWPEEPEGQICRQNGAAGLGTRSVSRGGAAESRGRAVQVAVGRCVRGPSLCRESGFWVLLEAGGRRCLEAQCS